MVRADAYIFQNPEVILGSVDAYSAKAPKFRVTINDITVIQNGILKIDSLQFPNAVSSVEFESADGMTDMLKINIQNRFLQYEGRIWKNLADVVHFQAGNEIKLFGGYDVEEFIGAAQIVRPEYFYPYDGTPNITITGYSRDYLMMDDSPAPIDDTNIPYKRKNKAGRRENIILTDTVSSIVEKIAVAYGFTTKDIGRIKGKSRNSISVFNDKIEAVRKSGTTDYDVLYSLANRFGAYFFTKHNGYEGEDGKWILYFLHPDEYKEYRENGIITEQVDKFSFSYAGVHDPEARIFERTTYPLLSFNPSYSIKNVTTHFYAVSRDPHTGEEYNAEIILSKNKDLNTKFQVDTDITLKEGIDPAKIKIFFEGYSFQSITKARIKSKDELETWLAQWVLRYSRGLVTGSGRVIGYPLLGPRQMHYIGGLGKAFDGLYYFNKVGHYFSGSDLYTCSFDARKVIGRPELLFNRDEATTITSDGVIA